jgi:hypothetical protein
MHFLATNPELFSPLGFDEARGCVNSLCLTTGCELRALMVLVMGLVTLIFAGFFLYFGQFN